MPNSMNLSLGPLLYYWPQATIQRFYAAACTWPVERVYLGEVVCSRRHEMRLGDWVDIAGTLQAAGKTVVLSSQALLESGGDLIALRKLAQAGYLIEANDPGAVKVAADAGLPFVAGPHLNIYSGATLDWYVGLGACRWVPPVEISRDTLNAVRAESQHTVPIEIFAHGHLPLAWSARCFTARHYDRNKDRCEFVCLEHPDGMVMRTREQQPFLRLNGIQTQSAACHSLWNLLPQLRDAGVSTLRISPQARHTGEWVNAWHAALQGESVQPDVAQWQPEGLVNGYWFGQPGITCQEAKT
ncbi:U32 family peptidase [Amantichitinum ursilacus]|uniref:Ubiquinone biosynthesis protein UbiV n=1 Tax=Amantichitinum ursilacus TaxID=857265 RepID=A0A0N0XHV7_9NEIS|nr:U32 family peptidase [Amantichitinum ursilacus]KPC52097.1 Peptidase family U32 [Amantichitinum ursilacus]